MQKIQGPGATSDGHFTEGNPATQTPATEVTANWLNAVQDELVNLCLAAGISLDDSNNAQLLAALAVLGGGRAGLRNLFVNGSFGISARKGLTTSYSIAAAAGEIYTLDRFFFQADGTTGGTGAATIQQSAHSIGQTVVPGAPKYFAHIVQGTAASAGPPRFGQRIEDVTQSSGLPITVSVWLQATAPIMVNLKVTQQFGAGGSTAVALTPVALSVGTGFALYQATFTPASVSGKTLGPNHSLQVELILPQGATYTLNVSQFQVEFGTVATPFETRSPALELFFAQRYYEASTPDTIAAGTGGNSGSVRAVGYDTRVVGTRFRARKRAVPSMTWWSGGGPSPNTVGNISWDNSGTPGGTNAAVTGVTATNESETGYPTCPSVNDGAARTFQAQWAADAEL